MKEGSSFMPVVPIHMSLGGCNASVSSAGMKSLQYMQSQSRGRVDGKYVNKFIQEGMGGAATSKTAGENQKDRSVERIYSQNESQSQKRYILQQSHENSRYHYQPQQRLHAHKIGTKSSTNKFNQGIDTTERRTPNPYRIPPAYYEQAKLPNNSESSKLDTFVPIIHHSDEKKGRPRRRRAFSELERNIFCPVEECQRKYASKHALNLHVRIKHPGKVEELASVLAKMNVIIREAEQEVKEKELNTDQTSDTCSLAESREDANCEIGMDEEMKTEDNVKNSNHTKASSRILVSKQLPISMLSSSTTDNTSATTTNETNTIPYLSTKLHSTSLRTCSVDSIEKDSSLHLNTSTIPVSVPAYKNVFAPTTTQTNTVRKAKSKRLSPKSLVTTRLPVTKTCPKVYDKGEVEPSMPQTPLTDSLGTKYTANTQSHPTNKSNTLQFVKSESSLSVDLQNYGNAMQQQITQSPTKRRSTSNDPLSTSCDNGYYKIRRSTSMSTGSSINKLGSKHDIGCNSSQQNFVYPHHQPRPHHNHRRHQLRRVVPHFGVSSRNSPLTFLSSPIHGIGNDSEVELSLNSMLHPTTKTSSSTPSCERESNESSREHQSFDKPTPLGFISSKDGLIVDHRTSSNKNLSTTSLLMSRRAIDELHDASKKLVRSPSVTSTDGIMMQRWLPISPSLKPTPTAAPFINSRPLQHEHHQRRGSLHAQLVRRNLESFPSHVPPLPPHSHIYLHDRQHTPLSTIMPASCKSTLESYSLPTLLQRFNFGSTSSIDHSLMAPTNNEKGTGIGIDFLASASQDVFDCLFESMAGPEASSFDLTATQSTITHQAGAPVHHIFDANNKNAEQQAVNFGLRELDIYNQHYISNDVKEGHGEEPSRPPLTLPDCFQNILLHEDEDESKSINLSASTDSNSYTFTHMDFRSDLGNLFEGADCAGCDMTTKANEEGTICGPLLSPVGIKGNLEFSTGIGSTLKGDSHTSSCLSVPMSGNSLLSQSGFQVNSYMTSIANDISLSTVDMSACANDSQDVTCKVTTDGATLSSTDAVSLNGDTRLQ
eukprot:CFRG7926T1